MDSTKIFLLADGRLRAGWRLLLFVIGYLLAGSVLGLLAGLPHGYSPVTLALRVLVRTLATVIVSLAMMRLLERRRFTDIGLRRVPGWGAALARGAAAGVALLALTTAAGAAAGGVTFVSATPDPTGLWQPVLLWTGFLMLAAASEEILFRGYPFQMLAEGVGPLLATALAAAMFAAMHLLNPAVTALSTANTALAGAMLSLAYLRSRALWYPIALHFAWNWAMAAAGFPVSGLQFFNLGWQASLPVERAWLHGGDYGPEGGMICTVVIGAMCMALWLRPEWVGCRALAASPPDAPPAISVTWL